MLEIRVEDIAMARLCFYWNAELERYMRVSCKDGKLIIEISIKPHRGTNEPTGYIVWPECDHSALSLLAKMKYDPKLEYQKIEIERTKS